MDQDNYTAWLMVVIIACCLFLGFFIGCNSIKSKMEKEAIKTGVATYEADSEGNSVFTYKKIKN
jgi:preprotein translocase subunit SecG